MALVNRARAIVGWEEVGEIRRRYAAGASQRQLGEDFGLSTVQVGRIVRGESWRPGGRGSVWSGGQPPRGAEQPRSWVEPESDLAKQLAMVREAGKRIATHGLPPSLLEGGDGGAEETSGAGLSRLQETAAEMVRRKAEEERS